MSSGSNGDSGSSAGERDRLAEIRSAKSLSELARITGADTEHDAYFEAKRAWRAARGEELSASYEGIPGTRVVIDGDRFWIHGITHADTREERGFLGEHVSRLLDAGATVYCEQGIRSMYFSEFPGVCTMDDYRWAMNRCRELDIGSHVAGLSERFEGLKEDIDSLSAQFQDAVFSLIESGGDVYGEGFESALGDVASGFLTSHEDMATGDDFESFRLTDQAARDPERLVDLQHYYERAFLPQPLEREWLRRHDPELEIVTHARNERMADYALYHNEGTEEVHLIVGAAHQPGVRYYLEEHRDGRRELSGFEPFQ